jgi:hypothetical protein
VAVRFQAVKNVGSVSYKFAGYRFASSAGRRTGGRPSASPPGLRLLDLPSDL